MGIGEAIAQIFLREGARVVLSSRDLQRAEAARQRLGDLERSFAVACDVADPTQIDALVKSAVSVYGRIDVWVNNAGIGLMDSVEQMNMADCRRLFDTNFFGAVQCMQAVIPIMKTQGVGTIINISSVAGHIAVPFMAAYSASKHALNAIGKAARLELAASGVNVLTVCPGYIATDFGQHALKGPQAQRISAARNRVSTQRLARAILHAYLHGSREIIVPWRDRIIIWVYQNAPWPIETAMRRLLKPAEQVHPNAAS
jgi:short-subunit dehydrogenase